MSVKLLKKADSPFRDTLLQAPLLLVQGQVLDQVLDKTYVFLPDIFMERVGVWRGVVNYHCYHGNSSGVVGGSSSSFVFKATDTETACS